MVKYLNSWIYEWLDTYKKIIVKPSTYDSYLFYATHIMCDKELNTLEVSDIQKMINQMVCDGLKLSTIKHSLTLIRQSLKKARSLGYIQNLSCLDDWELPRNNPKKIAPLRSDELNIILSNSHLTFYGDFFKTLVYTGCRVGEIIGLTWSDVDFFNSVLYIGHTDWHGTIQEAKTSSSRRTIPLYGDLLNIFLKLRGSAVPNGRVFLNTRGNPICYNTVLQCWRLYLNKIGIFKPVGFHVLRHTFAHNALRAGIPVKVVSAWLGHSDVKITLQIYDSISDDDFIKASERLKELFA